MKNKRTDTTSPSKWFSVHIFKMNKKKKIISWDYLCLSFTLWFGMSKTLETCILYVKKKNVQTRIWFGHFPLNHTRNLVRFLKGFQKREKKSRNFTIMNNNYILRGKNIKAVQIAMIDHHTTSYDPWVYCVLVLYIYTCIYKVHAKIPTYLHH